MERYPRILPEGNLEPGELYAVTEKMHGTNLGFWVKEDGGIEAFRRNGALKPGDKFYGWEEVLERLSPALKKLGPAKVFGELIGGHYPGCERVLPSIQHKVYYCPGYEYVIFDIKENGEFLPLDELIGRCKEAGLHVIEPWYRSLTLEQIGCLDPEVEVSRVPEMFGLPPVEGNIIEGWVLRSESGRRMVKFRTRRFRVRFDWDDALAPRDDVQLVRDSLTPEYFETVLSKELEPGEKDIPRLIEAIKSELVPAYFGRKSKKLLNSVIREFVIAQLKGGNH